MSFNSKVIVIGKGRFGNATAQGLREGFIVREDGMRLKCDVIQASATKFTSLSVSEMADELEDSVFVVYCGTRLSDYAGRMALAIQQAAKQSSGPPLEFIDFSNPDPILEKDDVSGTIDLWVALNNQGEDEEDTSKELSPIKVWKITEVGSVDVSGIVSNTDGLVYGSHPGQVPKIIIPNLSLRPAPNSNADLFEEARHRVMERAGIDCWHDGNIMGLAMFAFTSVYAIARYNVNLNGKEPHSNIIMYLLDKGTCWTALWMMVVSPFAGNLLALGSIYQNWAKIHFFQKIVTIFCSLLMIIPTILFSLCWALWIIARNMYFVFQRPVGSLYHAQSPDPQDSPRRNWIKATLVDMVNLKGETGCVGFVYALIHSFLGCVVCDVAYKGYWFDPETGRLMWRFELSMMTGCVSTALLAVVAMRSIMGKASWIRLKPLYSYVSPIGIWFGVVHVMAFGAKGWNKLFNMKYHNGQPSITFVSSMYPACVLLVHHIMATFGTKKVCANDHLWMHSVVNIATGHFDKIIARVSENCAPELLDGTMRANDLSMRDTTFRSSEYRSGSEYRPGGDYRSVSTKSASSSDAFDSFVTYLGDESTPKKI